MDRQIIYDKARQSRTSHLLTNCYSMSLIEKSTNIWTAGDNLVFSFEDHGIQRLVYFATEWKALDELLLGIDKGQYYMEFLTRNPDEYIPIKSKTIARMKRVANSDCSTVFQNERVMQFEDDTVGSFANIEDAHEINEIMWSIFHTEVSHLLTDDEVKQVISRKEITIHKDNSGQIDTILQVVIQPKKFYTNQAYNRGDKKNINSMLISRLKEYYAAGGRYTYCWVAEDNTASLKWNEKYGMIHDGMWNKVYYLER